MRRFSGSAILLFVALGLILATVGCSKGKETAQPKPAAPQAAPTTAPAPVEPDRSGWPVIVAFGDSLTAGQGVTFDRNYPSQLQRELDRQGYKYRIVNAGISGNTTTDGLARIETIFMHKPVLVLLGLGGNDGLRGQSMPQMKANLSKMIERIQKDQIQLLLIGVELPPNLGQEYTQSFKQVYTDVSTAYRVPLVQFSLKEAASKPGFLQGDGIHPTADGYSEMVKQLLPTLTPLLKR